MKKVLITGGSSGLGLELGTLMQSKGFEVINLSRSKSQFKNIKLDLSKNNEIKKVIQAIKKNHSDFDCIILNSGVMPLKDDIGTLSFDIDQLFKINVTGSIKLIDGLISLIKKNKSDVVVIGSTAGISSWSKHFVYSSTKHALRSFTKLLQDKFKQDKVRVIGFHPGGFNSNLRDGAVSNKYMNPKYLASLLVNILELPKNMEVSEIVISRKT